jgi:hypothetical protein
LLSPSGDCSHRARQFLLTRRTGERLVNQAPDGQELFVKIAELLRSHVRLSINVLDEATVSMDEIASLPAQRGLYRFD